MKVQRILETCLYAEDLEAAEKFYVGVLGLRVYSREPGRHVFFQCEEAMFLVFNPENTSKAQTVIAGEKLPKHGCRGSGHVAFVSSGKDLPQWKDRLSALGVAIEAEVAWPGGGRSIYIRDPAGNSVELVTPEIWGMSG